MFDLVKNKFLFFFPLLGGCFFIGVTSTLTGAFFLVFTIYTLPLERLIYFSLDQYIGNFFKLEFIGFIKLLILS